MNAVEIIARKRDGKKLSREEISFFVSSFVRGVIRDYQMSAFLMAVFIRGMDFEETGWLTDAMLNSGRAISFSGPRNLYIDKHSSGGIGDKVSLVLAPWVASCGAKVPMLSGRGLGHTGGTLDKLESIPGFRTDLTLDEFVKGVEEVGCVISGQTPEIAPADKLIYALRDVTGTVESIPLICGSILSKKLAAGPNGLVFDIKCGNGAFMKTIGQAEALAGNLIGVCRSIGKSASAIITDMNQPLGYACGNLLEVIEAVDSLKGNFPPDLHQVSLELGIEMLKIAGIAQERRKASDLLNKKLGDGSAYRKFVEMVEYQGGNITSITGKGKQSQAVAAIEMNSEVDGFIAGFETEKIGCLIIDLGGGRKTKDDRIDHHVGIIFRKKLGDAVKARECMAVIYARSKSEGQEAAVRLKKLIKIAGDHVSPPELIKKRIS